MQRFLVLASLLLVLPPLAHRATGGSEKEEAPSALGIRYVQALARKDAKAAKANWLSFEAVLAELKDDPEFKKVPPEEIKEAKEYNRKRDEFVDRILPKLIEELEKEGVQLKSLKHVKTEASGIRKVGNRTGAGGFEIHAIDGKGVQVRLHVDDGSVFKGRWYFTDRPMYTEIITPDGRTKLIGTPSFDEK